MEGVVLFVGITITVSISVDQIMHVSCRIEGHAKLALK